MKKIGVLKTVVVLQAVCMIVLSVVIVIKMSPFSNLSPDRESNSGTEQTDNSGDVPGQGAANGIAASVGGQPITKDELEQELYYQYGDAVLRTMMVHKAIDLEAKAQQLEVSADEQERELAATVEGYESEEDFYKVMKEQLGMSEADVLKDLKYRLLLEKIAVLTVQLSDKDVADYIDEHPEQFAARLQLHLEWIVTDTYKDASGVLDLLANGEDFAQMAKVYSVDSFTAEDGGDLGLIDSDDPFYDAEMLDTASRLQPGEMAGPMQVDGGYALIRLVERQKTSAMTGHRLDDTARKQLALSRAKPLQEIEDELLAKYEAAKTQ